MQRAVCEKDVARREPTDDETLAYAKSSLAGSEQRHYTCIVFSGDDSSKKASGFADSLERYLATRSFSSEKATVPTVKERAKKAGASLSSYSWTLGLESGTDLTQELNDLAVGAMSDPQPNQEDSTTTIYLCDDSYRFPASARISSLEKGDVPATLWKDVTDKAADSLWSSDCSSYVAKLLAQASVTYYPVPEGAPYNVDLSSSAQSSDSAAGSSASSQSSDEN